MKTKVVLTNAGHRLSGEAQSLVESSNRLLEASGTRGLSPRTVRSYAHGLARVIDWLGGQKFRFKQMNEARLLEWVAFQRKQELSAQTINHRLTTCYLFYRFCFNCEIPRSAGAVSSAPYYRGDMVMSIPPSTREIFRNFTCANTGSFRPVDICPS